ncbi:MAG: LysM peptidoglycan-binding domain-containing protein [Gammaproteobacteria bacterium]|nr:LysM peptidoglycan-binding domain-containing protein [Gammaproteobacteria bacterium]
MVTKFRFTLQLSGSALALALLTACAGSPPQQEVVAEPSPPPAPVQQAASAPAPAPVVAVRPDYPESYTVVRGDTLWDISARFLRDPWMWPQVWHGNPQIENPHLIYPGDVLRLYFIDGKPVLRVERPYLPDSMRGQEYRTERLSPRVREASLEAAIMTIPIETIRPFLSRPQVLTDAELKAAPYVVAHDDERLISGTGYRVFARGIEAEEMVGEYVVVRRGQAYIDPVSREHLGFEAIYLGDARLLAHGDPSTLVVTSSSREILNGDRLLPRGDDAFQHRYMPRPPADKVDGQIISVFDGVAKIGQHRVVAINLGKREGLEPGHVLAVNQRGAVVRDTVQGGEVQLPDERAGLVMVFRSFERVSYALVMNVTKPLAIYDQATNP